MGFCIECKHHKTIWSNDWRQFLCTHPELRDVVTGNRIEMECHEARTSRCDGVTWYEAGKAVVKTNVVTLSKKGDK